MSKAVITVENLSKCYVLSHQFSTGEGLRHMLQDKLTAPLRWLGQRRRNCRSEVTIQPSDLRRLPSAEEFWALKDVSFEVNRGEVLGIIGRNGAGKSTLLKIVSRITEPTKGRITIEGRVASLLEVGTGFHPELTGRENIFLNGAILGMAREEIKKKFDEIVAFAEVERFLDTPVKRFSSGMYVRLAFAVAAHLEPEILIVDEVLAVGDLTFQEKCLGKMNSVAQSDGRTVFFVSHNMAAIQQLCRRAILLREGQLVADGEPSRIVPIYMSDTVAAGKVSLRDWRDRVGGQEGKIVEFEVIDGDGEHTNTIAFGGTVSFRMTVEFYQIVLEPLFGVLIYAPTGESLLAILSFHGGLRIGKTIGRIIVEGVVRGLTLYPGEYTLGPWVFDNFSKDDVDRVRHCCSLRIIPPSAAYGELKSNPYNLGKFWMPSEWTVLSREEK